MTKKLMTSKRISSGLYEVTANGRVFEIEDAYQSPRRWRRVPKRLEPV
ncbi:hypothetical protein PHIN3_302 [Sinorhizobium phage phiN3]|uniref:Uncharacterized protein n=1 Tax=Sinorhizobium phage phiN3 TaxID=1647405 RepID=A0A0F6WCR1_9CAUD|nr:hypothetical protein AVT40_gp231 [Sinorhizobium phage phiN3]AKF13565.1 hypothetical protein PHIN3_302 [Sinorhizobium phage phiN3]